MRQSNSIALTKRLIWSVAALLLWMMLISGLFSLVSESTLMGIFWLVLSFALVIALVQGDLMKRLDGRQIPIASLALLLVILLLVGVTEIINVLLTEPQASASYVFDVVYSVGVVILGGYAGVLLLRAPRSQGSNVDEKDPSR